MGVTIESRKTFARVLSFVFLLFVIMIVGKKVEYYHLWYGLFDGNGLMWNFLTLNQFI